MTTMVYIDNDNINYMKYKDILETIKSKDTLYKIFCNEYDYSKIDDMSKILHKFIINKNNGKNTNDIALTIECINDCIYNTNIKVFIIVSNDSDFIPLCKHLKYNNKSCVLYCENDYNNIIYDNVVNIKNLYDKNMKTIHTKNMNDIQKNLEKSNSIKNKVDIVKKIYDNTFTKNTNCLSLDYIAKLYKKENINYSTYGRLKKYVIDFLPDDYIFENNILKKKSL